MKWGIELNVPAAYEPELQSLPPLSSLKWLTRSDGKMTIQAQYCFEYSPQSWREWQRIAAIKTQIANRLKRCEFKEYHGGDEVPERLYTISELGKHFPAFVKFPAPQFPTGKGEAYRMLCRHAKRLHYENLLHAEQLISASMRFNEVEGNGEGISQTVKRAKSAYMFAMEHCGEWAVKLSEDALKASRDDSRRKGAATTNGNSRGLSIINGYVTKAVVENGQPIGDAVKILGTTKRTAYRQLAMVRAMSNG